MTKHRGSLFIEDIFSAFTFALHSSQKYLLFPSSISVLKNSFKESSRDLFPLTCKDKELKGSFLIDLCPH